MNTNLKVALVHDYLKEFGGAERVLEALHEIFPEAPIFTAYFNPAGLGEHAKRLKTWNIKSSWLQKLPFANKLISPMRIIAPMIFESFDLSEYDVVISSCSIYFAKAVLTRPGALHISYIHTPPRYLYGYTTSFNYKKKWWTRVGGEIMNHFLRIYDFQTSQRPDILIANSKNVQERIKKFYRRDSVIIYPPIDVKSFQDVILANAVRPESKEKGSWTSQDDRWRDGYFLSVGRLVRGKGVDVIVEACGKLGLPLKVAGTGPELKNLKLLTTNYKLPTTIEFLGQVKDEDLPELYGGAKATIVASEDEDFGIVPVESMASGTPVIAVKAGGFLETVVEGKTGEFFDSATPESLMKVLKSFSAKGGPASGRNPGKYSPEECKKQAQKFSKERFKKEILELVENSIKS